MGMDHWLEYDYVDEDGGETELFYEIVEWRKQYWIHEVICKYKGIGYDGAYEISLKDVIALRNFFQLCIDNPNMMNIVCNEDSYDKPSKYVLVNSVKEINDFLNDFDTENLTGKLYYVISV